MSVQGVILIHGIGNQPPAWADALIARLGQETAMQVSRVLDGRAVPVEQLVAMEAVYWADVLEARERELARILDEAQAAPRAEGPWYRRLLGWLKQGARALEHRFIAEFIGDVIAYLEPETQAVVLARVEAALGRLAARVPPVQGARPLTVIAHSLGTVIGADFLRPRGASRAAGSPAWRLDNVFTLGSPLALFSLSYVGEKRFADPVRVESARGRWVNVYDKDDPVGMPLRPLGEAYGRAVLRVRPSIPREPRCERQGGGCKE